ncbi:MAG: hypothetical protein AAGA48_32935 [Myxococcota bacterium]
MWWLGLMQVWAGPNQRDDAALKAACATDDAAACFRLGVRRLVADRPTSEWRPLYLRACELEHDAACQDAWVRLGGPPDRAWCERKLRSLAQACQGGSGRTCGELSGWIVLVRRHYPALTQGMDERQTQQRACALGDALSCYAECLLTDAAAQLTCLEHACRLGSSDACTDAKRPPRKRR